MGQKAGENWAAAVDLQPATSRPDRLLELGEATIELRGDLGAGKTTLVRHLLRALGVQGRIKSPTYALVEPYRTSAGVPVHHFDFYRFGDPREWADAGLRDLYAGPGLKLAEWPEQAAGVLPAPDLAIHIRVGLDECRSVTVQAGTARGRALLQALEQTP